MPEEEPEIVDHFIRYLHTSDYEVPYQVEEQRLADSI
jgi:hypothetical protein